MGETDAAFPTRSPGACLQAARVKAGLSIGQVAERLHLDEQTLGALESGRLEGLGASVFVRGHLRRYAELVGVPEEEVMSGYEAWSGRLSAMPDLREVITAPGVRSGARGFELKPRQALIGAIALVLVALVWWAMRKAPSSAAAIVAVVPVVKPSAAVAIPAVALQPTVAAAPESQAAAPQGHLTLHFSQNSWVEVHDSAGASLFHQLGLAGSQHRVTGGVPLQVFLGNPGAVELAMDGHPVSLIGTSANAKLRRFSVDGAGHVIDVQAARP
jgi:cytoskeleton protein RodZ